MHNPYTPFWRYYPCKATAMRVMQKIMNIKLLLACFLLLAAHLQAEPGEPSKVVECSFVYWRGAPEADLYLRMGDYYHPLKFKNEKRSEPISLRRMKVFEVCEKIQNPDEGEAGYRLVANVEVPERYEKVLLLVFAPDEKQEAGYRLMVIDDSMEGFPASTYLFVNLGNEKITVDFADTSQTINAGEMRVMHSKVDQRGGLIPILIHDHEGKRRYENRLFSQLTARNVVFIGPPKWDGGAFTLGMLPQLLPQKVPPPPGQQ